MMQSGFDFDILELILQAITILLTSLFDTTIALDKNSLLIQLFNMLPVVGNNPVSVETLLYLAGGIGVIFAYYRWYK